MSAYMRIIISFLDMEGDLSLKNLNLYLNDFDSEKF